MGYLFLFLALAFGLIKAYCGKRTSSAAVCCYDAISITTVRMFLCFLIGLVLVAVSGVPLLTFTTPKVVLISALSGLGTACFTVCWLLAVRTMAYMLVEVFVMGSVIIPLTLCAFLYGERIGAVQIIGIVLLLIAVYCMCTYKKSEKSTLLLKELPLLLLCAASCGISDFSQKLYIRETTDANVSVFNLYTYLFAAIALLISWSFFRMKEKKKAECKSVCITVKPIIHYVAIMAICLFLNSYFKTLSSKYLDAVLLYPLNQGCSVALSLFMSITLFKEKINRKGLIGIGLAIIALVLINVFGE